MLTKCYYHLSRWNCWIWIVAYCTLLWSCCCCQDKGQELIWDQKGRGAAIALGDRYDVCNLLNWNFFSVNPPFPLQLIHCPVFLSRETVGAELNKAECCWSVMITLWCAYATHCILHSAHSHIVMRTLLTLHTAPHISCHVVHTPQPRKLQSRTEKRFAITGLASTVANTIVETIIHRVLHNWTQSCTQLNTIKHNHRTRIHPLTRQLEPC